MKRISVFLLAFAVLLLGGNGTPALAETDPVIGYADQQQFLKDMARGIQDRLAMVDDEKHADDTAEQEAEYLLMLVRCELDQMEKYDRLTFSNTTFDRLAHHYIDACKMQETAAILYKNKDLHTELWNSGSSIRAAIITELYTHYDLPISGEDAANYTPSTGSSGGSVTASTNGTWDFSTGLTMYDDNMKTYDTIKLDKDVSQVLFDDQGVKITLKSLELRNSDYYINMTIQNIGSKDSVACYVSSGYVDDYKITVYHPFGYNFVAFGKRGDTYSNIEHKDLKDIGMEQFKVYTGALYVITSNGSTGQYIAKIPLEISRSAFH